MQFRFQDGIAILERTPSILDAWLRDLPDSWAFADDGQDTWSPFDILGHLIHGENTDWLPRLQIILSDSSSRTFEPFDRFAQLQANKAKSVPELLDTFRNLRRSNVEKLRSLSLTERQYDRTAIHPSLGTVNLRQLLATWVAHDLNHLGQIAEVMARQYRLEVGPWRESLDIIG
jgi:uncharacterized damage-inducible protein DinB